MNDVENKTVLTAVVALVAVGAIAGLLLTGGVLPGGSSGDAGTPTDDAASAGVEPGDGNGSAAVESTPSPTPDSVGAGIDDATPTASPEPATETPEDDDSSSSSSSSSGTTSSSSSDDDDDDDPPENDDSTAPSGGTDDSDGDADDSTDDSDDAEPAPSYAVAADGSAEYESIQAAVDDASEGETVRVAPGTYAEQVRVAKNVTLVAPNGATLSGDDLDANESVGFEIASDADAPVAPTISGFEIRDFRQGVLANGTRGDWTVRNAAVRNVTYAAVNATGATGDWTVRDSYADGAGTARHGVAAVNTTGDWTLSNASVDEANVTAVWASDSTGDWTVANATYPGSPIAAVVGLRTTGDWTVRNVAIGDARNGVDARNSSGAWTVRNAGVYATQEGVWATNTTGDWTVADSTFTDHERDVIDAVDATGTWTVTNTEFLHQSGTVINAHGASPAGNATGNWWGSPEGPAEGQCVGNVDCGAHLAAPPGTEPVSMTLRSPFTSTWQAGFSQHPTVEFDRPVAFANGSRYELVVRDEDAGGELIVEPPVNETVEPPLTPGPNETVDPNDTVGTSLGLMVPHPEGKHGEGAAFSIFAGPSESANVTTTGEVTTRGVANLSVELRRAGTGDTLASTSPRPHLLGWQAGYEQNSTNGTVQIAVNQSTLPAGTNLTATVSDADATDYDGTDDGVELNLTYDSDYEARTDRVEDGAFVATFDADRLEGGAYDVVLDGRLPEPYGITFFESGYRPFEIDGGDSDSGESDDYDVAADGSAAHDTIQAAVDAASEGETVRVAPGTYEEQVRVAKNVTLVAPNGATLSGAGVDANGSTAVEIADADGPVAPTVAGFEVREYDHPVLANGTRGDWTVRNLSVTNGTKVAVNAANSTGDWTVRGVTVTNASHGIGAANASGDWTVRSASLAETEFTGIWATRSTGDWTAVDVEIPGQTQTAIAAPLSSGDWTVRNATVGDRGGENATVGHGFDVRNASGAWRVTETDVAAMENALMAANASGDWTVRNASLLDYDVGVLAPETTGSWRIAHTAFLNRSGTAIDATGASPAGNATRNWWGSPEGPAAGDCGSDVDCGDPLAAPPVSMDMRSPGAATQTWQTGHSQHPAVEFDRDVTFEDGSRYELVVRDEDAGGELVVEPPLNGTAEAGDFVAVGVPHPAGEHDDAPFLVFGHEPATATVATSGPVTTRGVANLSVALRHAGTGDTLARSAARPHLLGWQAGYEQNSTNGTVQIAVNRSTLPAGTNLTATVHEAGATDWRNASDAVEVNLTYDPDYESETGSVDDGAFVATFDADRLAGGDYDVVLEGRLPDRYGTSFFEVGTEPFEVGPPAPR